MRQVPVYLAAILIHEIFHMFAARVLFREKLSIVILPSGFSARWRNFQPEKYVQCIVCAFGPLGNILAAVITVFIPFEFPLKAEFIKANLFIGIFNLIPLYPMDGGNVLLILLYSRVGTGKTYKIIKKLGYTIRSILFFTGIYILIFHKNPSMFIAIAFLPGIGTVKRKVKHLNLSSLIRRRERILKKKSYQIRDILILKDVTLGEAVLVLDYDKYHIIHIADENLNILCQVTEQQVIDAILKSNVSRTLEEAFLQKQ